jgi:hypothetical protein
LKFSQFTKLDAQINPGCVIWFSIKWTPFSFYILQLAHYTGV